MINPVADKSIINLGSIICELARFYGPGVLSKLYLTYTKPLSINEGMTEWFITVPN